MVLQPVSTAARLINFTGYLPSAYHFKTHGKGLAVPMIMFKQTHEFQTEKMIPTKLKIYCFLPHVCVFS